MGEEHILGKTRLGLLKFSVGHQSGDVNRQLDSQALGQGSGYEHCTGKYGPCCWPRQGYFLCSEQLRTPDEVARGEVEREGSWATLSGFTVAGGKVPGGDRGFWKRCEG